jgi:hypothetical protein
MGCPFGRVNREVGSMRSIGQALLRVGGSCGLAVVIASLAGCDGGGGGGGSEEASFLELISFEQAERTDVARNQPLVFHFSAPIDRRSVSVDGFQIRSGLEVVEGRVMVEGRTLIFFPTVLPGERNDYTPNNNPPINGIGLRPAARYEVQAIANSPFSIRSRNGRPLSSPISVTFTTTTSFLPEDPPVPPQIVGEPIVFPERVIPGGSFFNPNDPPIFDPTNIRVSVQFSEPMNPGRLNPFTTFTVVNIMDFDPNSCPIGVPGLGEPILGNLELSPDASLVTFEPVLTLGDLPCSTDPFIFEVTVSPDLTDLAGNRLVDAGGRPLAEPFVFFFGTRDKPGEPNFAQRTEHFDDAINRGTIRDDVVHFTTALWTGNGVLEGLPVTRRTVTVQDVETSPPSLLADPLRPVGSRMQLLHFRDDFRDRTSGQGPFAESFIAMSWGPRSNYVFAATYPLVTLQLGHSDATVSAGLAATFDRNFSSVPNNPTVVFEGTYTIPNSVHSPWYPWPEFTTDFEYRGTGTIVFEANVAPGGETYQLFRNTSTASTPLRRIYDRYNATAASCPCLPPTPPAQCPSSAGCAENTVYHQQFVLASKKSYGVSRYYDTQSGSPDYAAALIVFDESRGGPCGPAERNGCFIVTWDGAHANASGRPDPMTQTGFSEDINRVDGHRFIRFEILFNGHAFSGNVPVIHSVSFAYQR